LNPEYIFKTMASDGTSLEDIEAGDVPNTADSNRMQAILRDMNAPSESSRPNQLPPMSAQPNVQDMQPMPSRQPMPPMLQMSSHAEYAQPPPQRQQRPQYVPVAEEEAPPAEPKKNIWSTVLEQIRDPFFVIALFFLLSLPAFHTLLGKYATWAFNVGGQLSWAGLGALSVLAGLVFGIFKTGCSLAGL
jgi:hypothetical protein